MAGAWNQDKKILKYLKWLKKNAMVNVKFIEGFTNSWLNKGYVFVVKKIKLRCQMKTNLQWQ